MDRIITFASTENLIERLAALLKQNWPQKRLERVAVVFGGRRPSLYLKKELAKELGGAFFSPAFFTMDEFMEYVVRKDHQFTMISEIESCFLLYRLNRQKKIGIAGDYQFARFLPWAREINSFIEGLDLEDVPREALERVEKSASIGYDVPEEINHLLRKIASLRDSYHKILKRNKRYTRGLIYLLAAGYAEKAQLPEFETIVFAGLFYLNKSEAEVINSFYQKGKAWLVFQGDQRDWPALERNARLFSCSIKPDREEEPSCRYHLYAGFDTQSQVCLVREIVKSLPEKEREKTVIVVPESTTLVPLLSEIASLAGQFNVSLGYPLKRSSIHTLFHSIFRSQETRRFNRYYVRDYLRVMSHPFIKNLKIIHSQPTVTRILVHRIEEALLGIAESRLSGSLFVRLKEIEEEEELFQSTASLVEKMGFSLRVSQLQDTVKEMHNFLFRNWEERHLKNFRDFSRLLDKFLDILLQKSFMAQYPLNSEFIQAVLMIKKEMEQAPFRGEQFPPSEIFQIFEDKVENYVINFAGTPLRGMQILGLLETRCLAFSEVIVLDANESILPRVRNVEPLISGEVMRILGIDRRRIEEEIQRYLFKNLIAPASNVHLIFSATPEKEKSRFIEEILWESQRKSGVLCQPPITKALFNVQSIFRKKGVPKTSQVVQFLKNFRYSPSSLDTYLRCPAMFYYRYVLGLEEKVELPEEPEEKKIGVFIHQLLEETYRPFLGKKPAITPEFERFFFQKLDQRFRSGFQKTIKAGDFLVYQILRQRLERFLDFEKKREVALLLSLEKQRDAELTFNERRFQFSYKVDRIERRPEGNLLVIDYKTGGEQKFPSPERLAVLEWNRISIKNAIGSFQLPLYVKFTNQEYQTSGTVAALYYLRTATLETFPEEKFLPQEEEILERCLAAASFILSEITDPQQDFIPDTDSCHNCQFTSICH